MTDRIRGELNRLASASPITDTEVERQLAKIHGSNTFQSSPKLRDLLAYIGRHGKETNEYTIARSVFGRPEDWNRDLDTLVRSHKSHLVKRLAEYYQNEGQHDPVFIDFPNGYEPQFRANPASPIKAHYELGVSLLSQQAPHFVRKAIGQFDATSALDPAFARAHASKAEALCTLAMYDYTIDPRIALTDAESCANEAIRVADDYWLAHASLATVHLFRREWPLASAAFGRALQCDRIETHSYHWYAAFLLSRDQMDEALEAIKDRTLRWPSDAMTHATLALYLHLLQQRDAAQAAVAMSLAMDEDCWLAYYVRTLESLSSHPRDFDDAFTNLLRVESILRYPLSPGLMTHCYKVKIHREPFQTAAFLAEERRYRSMVSRVSPNNDDVRYVKSREVALSGAGALCYEYERACDEQDPFMIWGKYWPALKLARREPRWHDLVERMNRPFDPQNPTR